MRRILIFLILSLTVPAFGRVLISEFNLVTRGDFHAWVELHNAGNEAVDLKGWGLSNLSGTTTPFALQPAILEPKQYALVHFRYPGPDGRWKTPADSCTHAEGGVLHLYTTDTIPNLDADLGFLVLTRSPGGYAASLEEEEDTVCMYTGGGELTAFRLRILQAVAAAEAWCLSGAAPEEIAGWEEYTDPLPLVYLPGKASARRRRQNSAYLDTRSPADWEALHPAHTAPGSRQAPSAAAITLASSRMQPDELPLEIEIQAPYGSHAAITIHDLEGNLIHTLLSGTLQAAKSRLNWSGKTRSGHLPSGVYLILGTITSPHSGELTRKTLPFPVVQQ